MDDLRLLSGVCGSDECTIRTGEDDSLKNSTEAYLFQVFVELTF